MSRLVSRTKGDMKYLFAKKSNLSKKDIKRKHRGWATLIGLILVLIQLVLTVLLLLKVFKLDILPMKYLIIVNVILALMFLYNLTSQFTSAHILGKIISVFLSGVILFIYLFAAKLDSVLNKITEPNKNYDVVQVLVLKDDKAETLEDVKNYKFGYNSKASNTHVTQAFSDIKKDLGKTINPTAYTSWTDLIDTFYENKDVQAIVINSSMLTIINQQYEDFSDKTKVVKSYEYEKLIEVQASNVDVKKDPFVIYVSGISSDDGADTKLASNALSDVNILAVINPETRQVLLVTTPRDSFVKISNGNGATGYDKLTHAGSFGIEQSIDALENLYGIDIDYYIKINFTGSATVVDALGGITVDSEVEFTNGYDAAPVRYHFVKGENYLDGEKCIAFSRERQCFPSGDFQRGRNQTAVIKGIIEKATSPEILVKYSAVLDAVTDLFLTNIPNSAITDLVKSQLNDAKAWNIQSFSISGDTGYRYLQVTDLYNASVVIPDTNDINTAIQLMSKIMNDEVFDVDEYVESLKEPETTTKAK